MLETAPPEPGASQPVVLRVLGCCLGVKTSICVRFNKACTLAWQTKVTLGAACGVLMCARQVSSGRARARIAPGPHTFHFVFVTER